MITTPMSPAKKSHNPLSNWYRQPKIYIRLPSSGKFYPVGALDISASEDYPVFAMTAKDELMFKTPDALLNGQSTVEVIKSCIPAILNPWVMPSIDVDAVLIAIRIATYGETMEVGTSCPYCKEENFYDVNITQWLTHLNESSYEDTVTADPIVIRTRPFTYKEITQNSLKTIEHQRIIEIVNNESMSDEEKLKKFSESFIKLTEMTVDVVAQCIKSIETPDGISEDANQIKEFIHNAPKEVFDTVQKHLVALKDKLEIPTQTVKCKECEGEYLMPIVMDQSNFFAVKS
jgi:hypothetical protein